MKSLKLSYLRSHAALPVCCRDALPLYVIAEFQLSITFRFPFSVAPSITLNVSGWFAGSAEGQGSGS